MVSISTLPLRWLTRQGDCWRRKWSGRTEWLSNPARPDPREPVSSFSPSPPAVNLLATFPGYFASSQNALSGANNRLCCHRCNGHTVGSIAQRGCTCTFKLRDGRIRHRAGTYFGLGFPIRRNPPRTTTKKHSLARCGNDNSLRCCHSLYWVTPCHHNAR